MKKWVAAILAVLMCMSLAACGDSGESGTSVEDASAYNNYCVAMRAYEAGGLNGVYKGDNGVGSYLYLVIRDGKVGTELIGYSDDNQEFTYEDSDLYNTIVKVKFTDETEAYAVGRYSTIGAEIEPNYIMYPDAESIMLIKYEEYEYDTFNGTYTKIAEE